MATEFASGEKCDPIPLGPGWDDTSNFETRKLVVVNPTEPGPEMAVDWENGRVFVGQTGAEHGG